MNLQDRIVELEMELKDATVFEDLNENSAIAVSFSDNPDANMLIIDHEFVSKASLTDAVRIITNLLSEKPSKLQMDVPGKLKKEHFLQVSKVKPISPTSVDFNEVSLKQFATEKEHYYNKCQGIRELLEATAIEIDEGCIQGVPSAKLNAIAEYLDCLGDISDSQFMCSVNGINHSIEKYDGGVRFIRSLDEPSKSVLSIAAPEMRSLAMSLGHPGLEDVKKHLFSDPITSKVTIDISDFTWGLFKNKAAQKERESISELSM